MLQGGFVDGVDDAIRPKGGAERVDVGCAVAEVVMTAPALGQWVFAGERADGERLWQVIEETEDDYVKVSLARLCALHFRGQPAASHALWLLGETMTRVAYRLTLEAERRLGEIAPSRRRSAMMGFVSLDRYHRLGISFLYDEASGMLRYDGAAFEELRKRYPRSAQAQRTPPPPLSRRE